MPEIKCPICGTITSDRFCPHCGRRNQPYILEEPYAMYAQNLTFLLHFHERSSVGFSLVDKCGSKILQDSYADALKASIHCMEELYGVHPEE